MEELDDVINDPAGLAAGAGRTTAGRMVPGSRAARAFMSIRGSIGGCGIGGSSRRVGGAWSGRGGWRGVVGFAGIGSWRRIVGHGGGGGGLHDRSEDAAEADV